VRWPSFGFRFADAFWKCFQLRAQNGNLVVNALQLNQVRIAGCMDTQF